MDRHAVNDIIKTTSAFKLLSDPTRCRIIYLLSKKKGGMCVYEIAHAGGISHSAASHQLSKLEAKGVVSSFPEGQKVCYRINDSPFTRNIMRVMKIFHL